MKRKMINKMVGVIMVFFLSISMVHGEDLLKWNAAPGNVSGYKVYYGVAVGTYDNSMEVGNVTEFSLSNLTLSENTSYYFVISSYNPCGESEKSSHILYRTPVVPDTSIPVSPQGVTTAIENGKIRLSWHANVESDLGSYKIHYGVSSRTYSSTISVGTETAYTFDRLEEGVRYYFAISAVDLSNNESRWSMEVLETIPLSVEN